jgi:hypothetical protein
VVIITSKFLEEGDGLLFKHKGRESAQQPIWKVILGSGFVASRDGERKDDVIYKEHCCNFTEAKLSN